MDKNDILDYVTETPGNTNRAVLSGMLDSIANAGGGDLIDVVFEMDIKKNRPVSNYTPMDIATFIKDGKSLRAKFDLPIQDNVLRYETSTYNYSHSSGIVNADVQFFFSDVKVYAYDNGDSISWKFENY